jgi:peptidoglycan DL-endopeptidase CwlO
MALTVACVIISAVRVPAVAVPTPQPGTAPRSSLTAIRAELEHLYHEASVATDAFNAAEEKEKKQSAEVSALEQRVAGGQRRLEQLTIRAGAAARAQYRSGGLPPEVHLLMSDDPQGYLRDVTLARQAQQGTLNLQVLLEETQQDLQGAADDASELLLELTGARKSKARAQKKIEERIGAAEKIESTLEQRELDRLKELEQREQAEAQKKWVGSGILKKIKGQSTGKGAQAIEYAERQLGKPYGWGDEGPDSYDCSGLTQMAWAAAGVDIPRTSQTQWQHLSRIGVEEMRPGDLIIYHQDASHVAIYIGDGSIIHSPRPGRHVTVAPAASMPILGVVRPD